MFGIADRPSFVVAVTFFLLISGPGPGQLALITTIGRCRPSRR